MFLKRFTLPQTPKKPSTNNNICLSKHSNYYIEIQTNFLQTFQQKWKEENISEPHSIKPLLMAWGYCADAADFNHEYIADRAVAVERIYQASKLLDTNPEAVSLINKTLPTLKGENYKLDLVIIHELENITNQILNGKVKFDFDLLELLNSTVERLLSKCFFIGYHLSNPEDKDSDTALAIRKIGHLSEHCFYTLDDLSLFTSSNKSQINQKNILIRYLYGVGSRKEGAQLDSNFNFEYVNNLIQKYKITNLILEDINIKMSLIKKAISDLQEVKPDYCADFNRFLNEAFKAYFQKCGLTYENKF